MNIKGVKVRKSTALGFRMAIEGDKNLRGDQVESNYVSFVKIKDCPIVVKDGKEFYDPKSEDAKSIPVTHGGTFYAYGKPKLKLNQKRHVGVEYGWDKKKYGDLAGSYIVDNNWIETPFYAVKDAQVYVGNTKRAIAPAELKRIQREKKIKRILYSENQCGKGGRYPTKENLLLALMANPKDYGLQLENMYNEFIQNETRENKLKRILKDD
ncbi:MAG: hypothetical protein M0R46_11605 [Candidatus Muirbacterium halophilum]|nr:hypothetical protein [Candidatus Muirbacterium halophilum]